MTEEELRYIEENTSEDGIDEGFEYMFNGLLKRVLNSEGKKHICRCRVCGKIGYFSDSIPPKYWEQFDNIMLCEDCLHFNEAYKSQKEADRVDKEYGFKSFIDSHSHDSWIIPVREFCTYEEGFEQIRQGNILTKQFLKENDMETYNKYSELFNDIEDRKCQN